MKAGAAILKCARTEDERKQIASLNSLVDQKLKQIAKTQEAWRREGRKAAIDVENTGSHLYLLDTIRELLSQVKQARYRNLDAHLEKEKKATYSYIVVDVIGNILAILIAIVAFWLVNRELVDADKSRRR